MISNDMDLVFNGLGQRAWKGYVFTHAATAIFLGGENHFVEG